MAYGVVFEVQGDHACFSRPELKVERLSYDCITPSAAVGILESIYWHPPMKYVIDKIHVLNPIKFVTVRKNELKSKAAKDLLYKAACGNSDLPYLNTKDEIQQRTSTMLVDVRYVIEAHFELDENKMGPEDSPAKYASILNRRLERGQCFQQPYLGVRECVAHVCPYEGTIPPQGYYANEAEHDFGLMLYGMNYDNPKDITPMFYRAVMRNGCIDVAGSEVYR